MTIESVFADLPEVRAAVLWPVPRGGAPNAVSTALHAHRVLVPEQVHGARVQLVTPDDPDEVSGLDGLLATTPGLAVTAVGADCQVLIAIDPTGPVIGIAHAGWRGIVADVGPHLIDALVRAGARPEQLHVYVSPSIGPCHYPVSHDIFKQFQQRFSEKVALGQDGKYVLDLREAQRQALHTAGILPSHLTIDARCTVCAVEQFPSHRRDGNSRTTNLVGCIMITA